MTEEQMLQKIKDAVWGKARDQAIDILRRDGMHGPGFSVAVYDGFCNTQIFFEWWEVLTVGEIEGCVLGRRSEPKPKPGDIIEL